MRTVLSQCVYTFSQRSKRQINKLSLFQQATFTPCKTVKYVYLLIWRMNQIKVRNMWTSIACFHHHITTISLPPGNSLCVKMSNKKSKITDKCEWNNNKPDLSIRSDPARSTISSLLLRTIGIWVPCLSVLLSFSWKDELVSSSFLTDLRMLTCKRRKKNKLIRQVTCLIIDLVFLKACYSSEKYAMHIPRPIWDTLTTSNIPGQDWSVEKTTHKSNTGKTKNKNGFVSNAR